MDDLISRQEAIDMLNKLDISDGVGISSIACSVQESAISAIQHLPSADAVEVVRCKDCKHSTEWYRDKRRCFLWCEDGISVFEDGFCNYGEQKDDEQNDIR